MLGARIAGHIGVRGRRAVQQDIGQAGEAFQARGLVKIADNLGHAERTQGRIERAHQGIDAIASQQSGQGPAHDVSATDDQ